MYIRNHDISVMAHYKPKTNLIWVSVRPSPENTPRYIVFYVTWVALILSEIQDEKKTSNRHCAYEVDVTTMDF